MREAPERYWYECLHCGFLASRLEPAKSSQQSAIDETHRYNALCHLRNANFEKVLDTIDGLRSPNENKVLDVGCAHGWFLDAAARRGYETVGLEPDPEILMRASPKNHRLICGYFPDDLPHDCFDIIAFHDVFEHLPDARAAAIAAHSHLRPNGMLVLNIPSNRGTFFRIARTLDRIGIRAPLDRMWQRGFPSPHLSYFNPDVLCSFLEKTGFREICRKTLPSVSLSGLWQRFCYDRSASLIGSTILWLAVCLARPAFYVLPADISLQIFRRID